MMRRFILCWAATSAIAGRSAAGQTRAATCEEKLSAASPDSQVAQLNIRVASFDTSYHLSTGRQGMIGEGIRQFITIPKVLALDVYTSIGKGAWPTITGAYRTTLHRDGHFTGARAVGGTRNAAFDRAVVAAIVALDTSGMIPPPDSASMGNSDSVDVRIVIATGAMWGTTNAGYRPPTASEGVTPLVRLRLPVRGSSGPPYPKPGNPQPLYPRALRDAGVQGETVVQFVIDAAGKPDASTVQVIRTTAVPFVAAVLDVLPKMAFDPLLVEGCPVASLATMPFTFSISR